MRDREMTRRRAHAPPFHARSDARHDDRPSSRTNARPALGSLSTASRLAPPAERGRAISAFFVACYAGLIIPVVAVGVATEFISDFTAVLALSILLAALCLFSFTQIRNAR
jgi:hypothetical protein